MPSHDGAPSDAVAHARTPEFPKVRVREAGARDARLLHELAAATFGLACPPETEQSAIDEFIAEHLTETTFAGYLGDPNRLLLIAEVDGDPAGYTMLILAEPTDADVAAAVTVRPSVELSKCYVLAAHHGRGVGTAIIEASVDAARERGAAGVWLGVNEHNARANRFYEKSGFTVIGHKHFLLGGNLEDDFVRERVIHRSD